MGKKEVEITAIASDRELAFTPAYRLVEMMRCRELSPVELMELTLRRIEEINPKLNAYLTVAGESAIEGGGSNNYWQDKYTGVWDGWFYRE